MKLEGSLDAFSLPDVFQLLSLTKKSGGLHLTNGQASGVVYFGGGSVTGAISDNSRQALARRLVGLGAADDAALRRAVERAAADGAGVTRALLDVGAVDPGLVQRLALEQAVDAVFDLLRWPNGDFSFAVDAENPDEVGLSVPAEQVVADATKRRESWESLSRLIPSPDVVLTIPVLKPEDVSSLTPDEWALLSVIDGERSVGVLVDVSGAGQFTVVSTLASMVQRGLLVLRDDESLDHVSLVRRRQQILAPLEGGLTGTATDEAPAPTMAGQTPVVPTATVPAKAGGPLSGGVPGHVPGHVPGSVPGAVPGAVPSAVPAAQPPSHHVAPAAAQAVPAGQQPGVLPGAHDPAAVVPPRAEPFIPKRVVEHPEPSRAPGFAAPATPGASAAPPASSAANPSASPATGVTGVATATAPATDSAIERDPTVNRSLMLRLIAGVRGL